MNIEQLKTLVPPPKQPLEIGTPDEWHRLEQRLALVLPTDYREFVLTYGTGLFAQFYRVYNPFSADTYMSLYAQVQKTCDWRRRTKAEFPERVPYAIYPDPGGILPWGNDENGHDYYWLTRGSPEDWTVVADDVRGAGFSQHNCTMTGYLLGVLSKRIKPLAGDYPRKENFVFEPFRE